MSGYGDAWQGGMGINRQNMNPTELAELGIQLAVAALQQTKQQNQTQSQPRMMSQEPFLPQYGDVTSDRYGFQRGNANQQQTLLNHGQQQSMMSQNFNSSGRQESMMSQTFSGSGQQQQLMMSQNFINSGQQQPTMSQNFGGMLSQNQSSSARQSDNAPPALMSIRTSGLRAPDTSSAKKNQTPASSQKIPKEDHLYKTVLCKKYLENNGSCPKGIHCTFAHGTIDLRSSPVAAQGSLFKTSLCHKFEKTGQCPNGADCRHAHGRGELRAKPDQAKPATTTTTTDDLRNSIVKKTKVKLKDVPELFKTGLCRKFMELNSCPNGSECQWAHGKDELRPKPSTSTTPFSSSSGSGRADDKYKTALCQKFEKTGQCINGNGCNYAHGRAELRAKGSSMPKPLSQLDADQYKTVLCSRYRDTGTCQYGEACGFAHGVVELRAPKTTKPEGTATPKKAAVKRPADDAGGTTSSSPAAKKKAPSEKEVAVKAKPDDKPADEKPPYSDIPSSLLKCHVCDGPEMGDRTPAEFVSHLKTRSHLDLLDMLSAEILKEADMMRCWVKRQEAIKKIKSPSVTTTECKMCEIKDVCGSLRFHRSSGPHLKLKKFLHPSCDYCRVKFDKRIEWEKHRLEEKHLAHLHKKGITKIDMNNGNPVEPSASKKTADDEFDQELKDAEEKQLNDDDFIMDYVVPEKEDEIPLGFSMVKPVNGHFCCVCKKFFAETLSVHCKSDNHYDKFVDIIRIKKERIVEKRRAAMSEEGSSTKGE